MAQRVESTGKGGDRSINSLYSRRYVNISSLLKELEKENKRKEKEIKHVVGGEGDENGEETKEKLFGKQSRKEEEACIKEDETRVNKESGENNDENIEELLFKTR